MLTYSKPITLAEDRGHVYFMDKDHPLADKKGRVYYARHVASIREGRWLYSSEVVKHTDGDLSNNHPDNLEILTRSALSRQLALERSNVQQQRCQRCRRRFFPPHSQGAREHYYCSKSCAIEATKRTDLTRKELEDLVWSAPIRDVAAGLGVSDAAVHKLCKKFGIEKPPRGHWLAKDRRKSEPVE